MMTGHGGAVDHGVDVLERRIRRWLKDKDPSQ